MLSLKRSQRGAIDHHEMLLILIVLAIIGIFTTGVILTGQSSDNPQPSTADVLEQDIDIFELTADDCTSLEIFDETDRTCYFECNTDDECLAIEAQIDAELNAIFDSFINEDRDLNEAVPQNVDTTSYTLTGNELSPTPSDARHAAVWDLFAQIAPPNFISENLVGYEVFSDTDDGTEAYVTPSEENPAKWVLGINLSLFYETSKLVPATAAATLIHEFAHVLTLEADQVPPDVSLNMGGAATCQAFYTGEGCAKMSSYINTFYQMFWAGIYDELPAEDASEDDLLTFYDKYSDRFLTEYAATNPGEDVAESFAIFVLQPKTAGNSIADQKQNFFYDYAELVQLRTAIQSRLGNI